MKCKKCCNDYCKLITETNSDGKDYSIGRGLIGEMLFGSEGFVLGFSNGRQINVNAIWFCERCGYKFKA